MVDAVVPANSNAAPANDNATVSDRDRMLAEIDAWWLHEHSQRIRGRSMRLTVRYVSELVTEELVLAFTGRRVESWRVEMSQPIEAVETFLLRIR